GSRHTTTGATIVAICGATIGYVIAKHRDSRHTTTQQAAAVVAAADHEAATMAQTLEPLGYEAALAVATLMDPDLALGVWVSVGLGRHATATDLPVFPRIHDTDTHFGIARTALGARVYLDMPLGFTNPDAYYRALPALANALRVLDARIDHVTAGVLALDLITRNPLAEAVELPWPIEEPVDLESVRVGTRDTGEDFRIAIRGNHILLVGLTGAGKSGGLWAMMAGLAPAIRDGLVQIHMVDLKRGMEMSAGYDWYATWATNALDALDVLQSICDSILATRADSYTATAMATGEPVRKHTPTPEDPHHVIFIDEIIALLSLPGDEVIEIEDDEGNLSKVRVTKYALRRLIEILTQARALGITVVAATQLANKAVLDLIRDLFPNIIGMRLASPEQEDMVFGRGARARGVRCTELTATDAGTVYLLDERGGSAVRGRFFHVPNARIKDLLAHYPRTSSYRLPRSKVFATTAHTPSSSSTVESAPSLPLEKASTVVICAAPGCTNVVTQPATGRPKKCCSANCRQKVWRSRQSASDN
ncbi:FtsK/SpoIIIE domain-containing protein, partial [Bacillus subtilis]